MIEPGLARLWSPRHRGAPDATATFPPGCPRDAPERGTGAAAGPLRAPPCLPLAPRTEIRRAPRLHDAGDGALAAAAAARAGAIVGGERVGGAGLLDVGDVAVLAHVALEL